MATFHGQAKPGDLCLIIQGPAVGTSCTFIEEAQPKEIITALRAALPHARIPDEQGFNEQKWAKIDVPVLWLSRDRNLECMIPYETISNLMPIQPPASIHEGEKQKELDHA